MLRSKLLFVLLFLFSSSAFGANVAGLSVNGNTISWTADGWMQVQDSLDFTTVTDINTGSPCQGMISSCSVGDGLYIVINHSNGVRDDAVEVSSSAVPDAEGCVAAPYTFPADSGWYQLQSKKDWSTVCQTSGDEAPNPPCENLLPGAYQLIRFGADSVDTSDVSLECSSSSDSRVAITNVIVQGDTIRVQFTDSQALNGVTRYDGRVDGEDYVNSVVAPANELVIVGVPTDGQQHTVTILPPNGNNDDRFDPVETTFVASGGGTTGVIYPINFGSQAKSFGSLTKTGIDQWLPAGELYENVGEPFLGVTSAGELRHRYVPTPGGPQGSRVVVLKWRIPHHRGYRLKESLYFEPGFKWGRDEREGGPVKLGDYQSAKLGFGFAGGSAPAGGSTSRDGFTARLNHYGTRIKNLPAILEPGQPAFDGTARFGAYTYRADRPRSAGRIDIFGSVLPVGEWIDVVYEVIMNSSISVADGSYRIWVNGVLELDEQNVHWWSEGGTPQIDTFMYSSFFGGNRLYAPPNTVYARVRDVAIAPVINGESAIQP